jgi:hypothetical protein
VQAGEGLPSYDFAMFEPRVTVAPGSDDEVTTVIGRAERRDVLPGQDMVF